jgi:hypothetical protein
MKSLVEQIIEATDDTLEDMLLQIQAGLATRKANQDTEQIRLAIRRYASMRRWSKPKPIYVKGS